MPLRHQRLIAEDVDDFQENDNLEFLRFVYAMYDVKFKVKKSVIAKIQSIVTIRGLDRDLRNASKLTRRISKEFAPADAPEMTKEEKKSFKRALEKLVLSLGNLFTSGGEVKELPNPYMITEFLNNFITIWNSKVRSMHTKFLQGYGIVQWDQLKINNSNDLVARFEKLKVLKECVCVLNILKDAHVCKLLQSSIKFVNACNTLKVNRR